LHARIAEQAETIRNLWQRLDAADQRVVAEVEGAVACWRCSRISGPGPMGSWGGDGGSGDQSSAAWVSGQTKLG
jgi:hypothetical protein